jgi:eukaryotic-like serine/threonine-protein kinase
VTPENGPLSGHRLGAYQLLELLNVGGMAEVYRGRDLASNRAVAVKVLPPTLAADPEYVARFKYEAALVGELAHPNIVPIISFGEEGPYLYLVMPLLKGSLRDILNRGETPHPIDTISVGMQIASALAAVHALGLIHRDVKPDNILLSENRALLTDFGITRRIEAEQSGETPTLAGTGLPIGTPQYMAPEQLNSGHVDQRADLYALGAVLYELLTGRPPHVADGPYAVASRVINDPVVPPSKLNPAIWPELDAVVLRALARDPADRYANATVMHDALKSIDQQYRSDMTVSRRGGGETEVTAALPQSVFPFAPPVAAEPQGPIARGPGSGSVAAPVSAMEPAPNSPVLRRASQGAARSGAQQGGGQGRGNGDNGGRGGNGGGGGSPGRGNDDDRRRIPQPALLIALAAVMLAVSVFCGATLFMAHGGPSAKSTPTSTLPYDPTYEGKAATATVLEETPTVTTGPNTPTPTPRPPLPTRTPTPRPTRTPYPPTVTTGPNTPTPTPRPPTATPTATLTPNPTPTFTPIPTPTPTWTATPTPTDTPTPTPTPPPPVLDVTPLAGSFTCSGGITDDQFTVMNIGGGMLHWSVTTTDGAVSAIPSGGSLGQGGSIVVDVSGTPGGDTFDVNFTSDGGPQTVTYTCS